ncbi:hypothetical protein BpHYR1_014009 [Brachionus plicatilis]|uniref:Uncharacterized protein n=1 Tax=Brachionus plicatilis TaxID=10195 RepID=A0A3M7QT82_BRAPC|nr:hypothetical protein BpHYR1_014009 [Brachionus plicatilis]
MDPIANAINREKKIFSCASLVQSFVTKRSVHCEFSYKPSKNYKNYRNKTIFHDSLKNSHNTFT